MERKKRIRNSQVKCCQMEDKDWESIWRPEGKVPATRYQREEIKVELLVFIFADDRLLSCPSALDQDAGCAA